MPTFSILQLVSQLKAQSDRLAALVANAGAAVPASAGNTFTAGMTRAMTALTALANVQADAASQAGAAQDIPAKVNQLATPRLAEANAAIAALDGEAATIVKALDKRFTVKKPAGLDPTAQVYKCQQLTALFARQGGDSPAALLQAVSERLGRALDTNDNATAYAIVEGLGSDYAEAQGIDQASWDATIANVLEGRMSGDEQESVAALYDALTRGGAGGLQEFCQLAGVLIRSQEQYGGDPSVPASMRGAAQYTAQATARQRG